MTKCTRCGGTVFERMQRLGFLQTHVLPFFNLYPWRCVICSRIVYRAARSVQDVP